jgi:hypothetical protein
VHVVRKSKDFPVNQRSDGNLITPEAKVMTECVTAAEVMQHGVAYYKMN